MKQQQLSVQNFVKFFYEKRINGYNSDQIIIGQQIYLIFMTDQKNRKKTYWTLQEDQILIEIMEEKKLANKWVLIAKKLNDRAICIPGLQAKNNKQCRQRWVKLQLGQNGYTNSKKTLSADMKKAIFTFLQQGLNWKKISQKEPFAGIPSNDIKNRYYSFMKTTLRAMCKITNHSIKISDIPNSMLKSMQTKDGQESPLKKHIEFIKEYSNEKAYKKCVNHLAKSMPLQNITKMNYILDDFAALRQQQKENRQNDIQKSFEEIQQQSQPSETKLFKQEKNGPVTPSKTLTSLYQDCSKDLQHHNSFFSNQCLSIMQYQNDYLFQNQSLSQYKMKQEKNKSDQDSFFGVYIGI